MTSLIDVLRFYRIHTGAATAALPTLAVLTTGTDPLSAFIVFLIALFHHAWGFSLNEIGDLEVDRMSDSLSHKPLVSGSLSKGNAWVLSIIPLVSSSLLLLLLIVYNGVDLLIPVILFSGSTLSGIIYDMKGKEFPSDIFVSIWILLLVLSTSSAVVDGFKVGIGVIAVASLSSLQLLFNNSVEGGIKDLKSDRMTGAKTMAITLGCRAVDGGSNLTSSFIAWGYTLRSTFVLCASVFSLLLVQSAGWGVWWNLLIIVLSVLIFVHSGRFMIRNLKIPRKELIGIFSRQEISSFLVICLVVLPVVGILETTIIFLTAGIWFTLMNRIMYGTSMRPGV